VTDTTASTMPAKARTASMTPRRDGMLAP
jgi:hypothetical protein